MNHSKHISQLAVLTLSLLTAVGVLLHDTRIDKATTVALTVPVALVAIDTVGKFAQLSGDPHTHSERGSLSQAVRSINSSTPRIQPRDDDKRYHLQKKVAKGVHAFDGYYFPLS